MAAAVRRGAAAAVPGAGPGGEAPGPLPRRAHRRGRPRGTDRRAVDHRRPARPGDLRHPDHPRADRGRAAGRPGGHHRPRADAGRGEPGRSGLGDRRRLHPLHHRARDRHRPRSPRPSGPAPPWRRSVQAPTGSARRPGRPPRPSWPRWPDGWPNGRWRSATSAPASPWRRPTWPSPVSRGRGPDDRRARAGATGPGGAGAHAAHAAQRRSRPGRPGPGGPGHAPVRAAHRPATGRGDHALHQRGDRLPHARHPGGLPAVLLRGARAPHRHQAPGRLPGARASWPWPSCRRP